MAYSALGLVALFIFLGMIGLNIFLLARSAPHLIGALKLSSARGMMVPATPPATSQRLGARNVGAKNILHLRPNAPACRANSRIYLAA